MTHDIIRPMQYSAAQLETKAAYQQYNFASTWLDLCRVRERNAELASQAFEHVAKGKLAKRLGPITDREREIGIAFARYAATERTDE